jgi:threonine aldolase
MRHAGVGSASSYGDDAQTSRLEQMLDDVFETRCAVFPVSSGTAANAIALAAVTPSFRAVGCTDCAHILTSECGAPEFYTGGAKIMPLGTEAGLMRPEALEAAFIDGIAHGVHQSRMAAISLTQATEWGTVYDADRVTALSEIAHRHEAVVHMDGARFGNALVTADVGPADMTWRAGVDMLSFGATKNGAIAAEAIIVFDPRLAHGIAERRKQSGHLLSKQRFLSAQLVAYLEDDLWLRNARHANKAAARLGAGLAALPGVTLAYPVEANEVFIRLPLPLTAKLEEAGIGFYRWATEGTHVLARLVTSFTTPMEDVDAAVGIAASLI